MAAIARCNGRRRQSRWWRASIAASRLAYEGHNVPPHATMMLDRAARALAMAWSMMLVLFQLATRFLNHDLKWRATLAEAGVPALYRAPSGDHRARLVRCRSTSTRSSSSALILTDFSFAVASILIGREIDWLRLLIGLSSGQSAGR